MTRELLTSLTDYRAAVDRVLERAENRLRIIDQDLADLGFEQAERLLRLDALLRRPDGRIEIGLRDSARLLARQPRLLALAERYGEKFSLRQLPPELVERRDGMLLADAAHALIRFEKTLPRSKLLLDAAPEVRPYSDLFDEIWLLGGDPVARRPLGL